MKKDSKMKSDMSMKKDKKTMTHSDAAQDKKMIKGMVKKKCMK